jgi:hypothetical protein
MMQMAQVYLHFLYYNLKECCKSMLLPHLLKPGSLATSSLATSSLAKCSLAGFLPQAL